MCRLPGVDVLHLLNTAFKIVRVFQDAAQQARPLVHGGREFGEKVKKLGIARQKTNHDTFSKLEITNGVLSHAEGCGRKDGGPDLLRAGMGLVVDVHHVLDGQLRIALRGREPLVAQQFLDRPQVGAFFQHVRSEGMAECVQPGLTKSMRQSAWL